VSLDDANLDPETEERIEQPISAEAEREVRLTPSEAVARMKINARRARTGSSARCSSASTATTS
jgi:hypothetical protein